MLSFYHKVSHYSACSAVITMIKRNYERGYPADEWVWFIAFETSRGFSSAAAALCIWQSWISQQADVRQRYNERLAQCVTWYFRMACFFSRRGPGLNRALWPGQGDTFLSRGGQHSLSIFLIVSNTTCFCQHTQGFGNITKKCVWQKIPTERVWIAVTHIGSTNINTQFIKCLAQRLFQTFYSRNALVSFRKHMHLLVKHVDHHSILQLWSNQELKMIPYVHSATVSVQKGSTINHI